MGRSAVSAAAVARTLNLEAPGRSSPTPRLRKRTYSYLLRSMRTLRFLVITRAGRVARIGGRNVLRLGKNPATQLLYRRIDHAPAP